VTQDQPHGYRRVIQGSSFGALMAAREKVWRADLLGGTETAEEAAYRLRVHSIQRGDLEGLTCDDCGRNPSTASLTVFGSPGGIVDLADASGWRVPHRWALESLRDDPAPDFSARVFVFCRDCWPLDDPPLGGDVLVEPGYEETVGHFAAWLERDLRGG
jgi:hypothetical protein